MDNLMNNLLIELRKGTQILIVLSQLKKPQYAYSLLQKLEEKNINIEPGTLYPLLRRLEKQGLLVSIWDKKEVRPRKYYEISELGIQIYQILKKEWDLITAEVKYATQEDEV